jgi:hypothetical protein
MEEIADFLLLTTTNNFELASLIVPIMPTTFLNV